MARKRKVEEKGGSGESGTGRWMLTYLDMVTLLFGVFVLMYALKEESPARVAAVEESIRQAFLGGGIGRTGLLDGGLTSFRIKDRSGRAYLEALRKATELFKPEIKAKEVRIEDQERGILISFVGETFFPPGSALLTDTAKYTLTKVADIARGLNSFVRVEGYSDEVNSITGRTESAYETDWELAAARAINVIRYLSETSGVEPAKLSATSYGKFRNIVPSTSPEGRSFNRRVDIIIIKGADFSRSYKDEKLPEHKLPQTESEIGP